MTQIRLKKLGLLILDARRAARRGIEECADAIGVSMEDFKAFEKGVKAISLPELENLAFYMDVPLDHFWGSQSISAGKKAENIQQKEELRKLRDRMIGASLRGARLKLILSTQQVSATTSIVEEKLNAYEEGSEAVPLPDLEILANALNLRVEDLIDQLGPIGKWRSERIEIERFMGIEPEVRQFMSAPINLPYLTLARRLSQMSVEKLRTIAEALLEITF